MPFIRDSIQAQQQFQQMKRPSFAVYFGMFVNRLVRRLVRLAWTVRVSLVWFVLFLFAWHAGWVQAVMLVLVAAGLAAGAKFAGLDRLWAVVPFVADSRRFLSLRRERRELQAGLDFLIKTGVVSESQVESEFIEAYLRPDVEDRLILTVPHPIRGVSPKDLVAKTKSFQGLLNAVRSTASALEGGGVEITFFQNDPLDEPFVSDRPAVLNENDMSVECAINADKKRISLTFGNSSGMVVAGIPGSGKTAGITSFLLPLALSEHVSLSVIDGKGGEDWTQYAPLCEPCFVEKLDEKTGDVVDSTVVDGYIRGDEDLVPIRDFLRSKCGQMYDRLGSQKQRLGTSNFWEATPEQRLAAGLKLELIAIDECQGLFEGDGLSKEEKSLQAEIRKYLAKMVKRGRSTGFFVIFITQKPTSESLPTAIRDNCGLRVAFHLMTSAAEQAVLGATPDDVLDMPRALNIPDKRRGGAIVATDTGKFEEVRFVYVAEAVQEEIISSSAKASSGVQPEGSSLGEEISLDEESSDVVGRVDLIKGDGNE